jgi:hypothetical protein
MLGLGRSAVPPVSGRSGGVASRPGAVLGAVNVSCGGDDRVGGDAELAYTVW